MSVCGPSVSDHEREDPEQEDKAKPRFELYLGADGTSRQHSGSEMRDERQDATHALSSHPLRHAATAGRVTGHMHMYMMKREEGQTVCEK